MKYLYQAPMMTVLCPTDDVLKTSGENPFHYLDQAGEGDSVSFAG